MKYAVVFSKRQEFYIVYVKYSVTDGGEKRHNVCMVGGQAAYTYRLGIYTNTRSTKKGYRTVANKLSSYRANSVY